VKGEGDDETRLPSLYARPGDMEAVESVLRQLQDGPGACMNAGRDIIRVCSVSRLFHELLNESMGIPKEAIVHLKLLRRAPDD
jgi:hypothetical protein